MMRFPKRVIRAIWIEYQIRPNPTALALAAIPAGFLAILLGEGASRAFTILGGGDTIPVIMGVLLFIGGSLTLLGACKIGKLVELVGLAMTSGGAFIYSAGVVGGLGLNGVIAGLGYFGIFGGSLGRVFLLVRDARMLSHLGEE